MVVIVHGECLDSNREHADTVAAMRGKCAQGMNSVILLYALWTNTLPHDSKPQLSRVSLQVHAASTLLASVATTSFPLCYRVQLLRVASATIKRVSFKSFVRSELGSWGHVL